MAEYYESNTLLSAAIRTDLPVSAMGRPASGQGLLAAPLPGDGPIGEAWLLATATTIPASSPTARSKAGPLGNC